MPLIHSFIKVRKLQEKVEKYTSLMDCYHRDKLLPIGWWYFQVKKLQEKVEKCQRDVEQMRDKYEEALKDLESYKIIYMGDMTEVFERTQNFEEKRLSHFKDILIGIHGCLDLTKIPKYVLKYPSMYYNTKICAKVPNCVLKYQNLC